MPLVDLPLEQLRTYRGINPRPADFDRYWEESLTEMKAIDPKVELVPADFKVPFGKCFHMTFTGVKEARIYAKLIRPQRIAEKHPAVLQFHGYTGRSGSWTTLATYAAEGFTVAALDCRGQAGRSEDPGGVKGNTLRGHIIRGLDGEPKDLLFRDVFLDTAQLAGLVMAMDGVDENRVGTMGGSQGGALALACAALEPRIKQVCAAVPFLCDYKRVWEMDLTGFAYEDLKLYFKMFDPCHRREDTVWQRLGYIDIQHLAPRIRADVVMYTSLMDTVCPPSTQFAAYNKIPGRKEVVLFPDFGHEDPPGSIDYTFQTMLHLLPEYDRQPMPAIEDLL